MPSAAPVPARPINKPLPTLLDIKEAPICKQMRIMHNKKITQYKMRALALFENVMLIKINNTLLFGR